ncbi:MAG: GNAT family N-acetyltransferase [Eubacteriales bacterium]|nr:GNAT family N-acetyltransferase [Eubacteriales bacterium]
MKENNKIGFSTMDDSIRIDTINKDEYHEYQKIIFDSVSPMMQKLIKKNPGFERELFDDLLKEESFYCTIRERKTLKFCGYCGIKDTRKSKPELAIELLKEVQHKGIGTQAMKLLLQAYMPQDNFEYYRYVVAADNYPSQRLCEKLGGVPNGIVAPILKDPKLQEIFEEKNLDLIDEKMITLADEFKVEPRKLLSHFLEYKICRES